jgi:hypothetical protein
MNEPETKGHKVHDTTKMKKAEIDRLCEEAKKEAEKDGARPIDSTFDLASEALADD